MSFDGRDAAPQQTVVEWLWLLAIMLAIGLGFAAGVMWLAEHLS